MRNHLDAANPYLAHAQARMRARLAAQDQPIRVPCERPPVVDPDQTPYTVGDLMVLHNLSRPKIIEMYEDERGVEIVPPAKKRKKLCGRRHRTLRIPRHVYMRVRNRMRNQ